MVISKNYNTTILIHQPWRIFLFNVYSLFFFFCILKFFHKTLTLFMLFLFLLFLCNSFLRNNKKQHEGTNRHNKTTRYKYYVMILKPTCRLGLCFEENILKLKVTFEKIDEEETFEMQKRPSTLWALCCIT